MFSCTSYWFYIGRSALRSVFPDADALPCLRLQSAAEAISHGSKRFIGAAVWDVFAARALNEPAGYRYGMACRQDGLCL